MDWFGFPISPKKSIRKEHMCKIFYIERNNVNKKVAKHKINKYNINRI